MSIATVRALCIATIGVFILSMFANANAQTSETLTLINDSKINGHIIGVACESQSVTFDIAGIGTAAIRWEGITSMRLNGVSLRNEAAAGTQAMPEILNALMPYIKTNSQSSYTQRTGMPLGGNLTEVLLEACARGAFVSKNEPPIRDARGIGSRTDGNSSPPPNASFWVGKVEASSVFTVGTQTQETLSGRLAFAYQRNPSANSWSKHTVSSFEIEAAYGNAAKKGSPRIMTNQVSYGAFVQSFIKSRTTLFPFGSLYHNFSQGMRLEQSYGFGVKHSFRPSTAKSDGPVGQQVRHNLTISADIRAIHENFGGLAPTFSSPGTGLSLDDSFHLGVFPKPILILSQHVEVVPAFKSAKAFQARAASTITVPVTKRFGVNFQFNDFYIRNAPPKHRQNYSKTTLSFSYLLGKI